MIFGYLILFISVTISAIAAYYSVVGLTAIFAAAVVPVMIMGGALEAGKIAATVWLHNNWKRAGYAFKLYLVPAIVFLMLLTSMGIFGFLSKAHGDQSLVSGDAMAKVAIYDEKIKIAKDNIDANRKALKQMDEAVDQVMGRSSDEKGADKAVAVRRSQQKERARLQSEIQTEQKTITALSEESAPLRAEFRKVEAEVGPIKYIAALIYGDEASQNMLEAAVRWVIILIVVVFDPLALCLILAANKQLEWARHGEGGWVHDDPVEEKPAVDKPAVVDAEPTVEKVATESTPTEPAPVNPLVEPDFLKQAEDRVKEHIDNLDAEDKADELAEQEAEHRLQEFFDNARLRARALDDAEAQRLVEEGNAAIAELEPEPDAIDPEVLAAQLAAEEEARRKEQEALDALAAEFERLTNHLHEVEGHRNEIQDQLTTAENQLAANITIRTQLENTLASQQQELTSTETERANLAMAKAAVDADNVKLKAWVDQLQADLQAAVQLAHDKAEELAELELIAPPEMVEARAEIIPDLERPGDWLTPPADNDDEELTGDTEATFGTEFPKNPGKGDLFLRVDYLPERLFKWNGIKWIELSKDKTDRFAFDQAYIQHLVEKIQRGEYDPEDLNDTEQAQVAEYLKNNAL